MYCNILIQLGKSNWMWGCKSYLPFSSPLQGFSHSIWPHVPSPEELHQDWIPNAMVWVARKGDGDGIASAPVNLFYPMKVLWSRGEKGNPACKDKIYLISDMEFATWLSAPCTVLLLSQSNCSLATWEPIGQRQTVMSLCCTLTALCTV